MCCKIKKILFLFGAKFISYYQPELYIIFMDAKSCYLYFFNGNNCKSCSLSRCEIHDATFVSIDTKSAYFLTYKMYSIFQF